MNNPEPALDCILPNLLLQAQGVSAKLGSHLALNQVNIALPRGQWCAVVGTNGSGKSTLLRCLVGLQTRLTGTVQWHLDGAERCNHAQPGMFAWLGQDNLADDNMRVEDTVALGRLPHQRWLGLATPSAADKHAVAQALIDTDMVWAKDRRMGQLSGGERQRVHLARTLAVQAPLLLLDEPLAHLDVPHQRRLVQVLRTQAAQGCGIISVLHELPWALFAHSLIVMQAGKIVAQGGSDQPHIHRVLEAVFEHAIRIEQAQGQWVVLPRISTSHQ